MKYLSNEIGECFYRIDENCHTLFIDMSKGCTCVALVYMPEFAFLSEKEIPECSQEEFETAYLLAMEVLATC